MIQCQESVLVVDRQGGGGGVGRFYDEDRRRADSYCTRVFVVGRIKICAEILHKRHCVCFYLVFTYWHKEHDNLANLLPSRTTSSPRRQECQIRNVFLKDLPRIDTIEISFWKLTRSPIAFASIYITLCFLPASLSLSLGFRLEVSKFRPWSGLRRVRRWSTPPSREFDLRHFCDCLLLLSLVLLILLGGCAKCKSLDFDAGYLIPGTAPSLILKSIPTLSFPGEFSNEVSINWFIHKIAPRERMHWCVPGWCSVINEFPCPALKS